MASYLMDVNIIFQENMCLTDLKGVLHPRPVFGLFVHFSQNLQHIGNR